MPELFTEHVAKHSEIDDPAKAEFNQSIIPTNPGQRKSQSERNEVLPLSLAEPDLLMQFSAPQGLGHDSPHSRQRGCF
jgi:hypothetical protein